MSVLFDPEALEDLEVRTHHTQTTPSLCLRIRPVICLPCPMACYCRGKLASCAASSTQTSCASMVSASCLAPRAIFDATTGTFIQMSKREATNALCSGISVDPSPERGASYYLVTELKDIDLREFVNQNKQPAHEEVQRIALDICNALVCCFRRSIMQMADPPDCTHAVTSHAL